MATISASIQLRHMSTEHSLFDTFSAWGPDTEPSTSEDAAVQEIDAADELEPDPRKGRRRTRVEKGSWADGALRAEVLPHQACESRCHDLPQSSLQHSNKKNTPLLPSVQSCKPS